MSEGRCRPRGRWAGTENLRLSAECGRRSTDCCEDHRRGEDAVDALMLRGVLWLLSVSLHST